MTTKEGLLHEQVANYLKAQYPGVHFRTDFAAGIKMTMGQASRHRKLQSGRGWPDLFVAVPRGGWHGLFIELKAAEIYRKGTTILLKDEHLAEQQAVLASLTELGYYAVFGIGFDATQQIIDNYLS